MLTTICCFLFIAALSIGVKALEIAFNQEKPLAALFQFAWSLCFFYACVYVVRLAIYANNDAGIPGPYWW